MGNRAIALPLNFQKDISLLGTTNGNPFVPHTENSTKTSYNRFDPPPENIPDELDDIVLLDLGIVFDSLGSFPAHHCRNSYQRWACASASPPDLIISLIRIAAIKVNH